jgi:hypothetical protein
MNKGVYPYFENSIKPYRENPGRGGSLPQTCAEKKLDAPLV